MEKNNVQPFFTNGVTRPNVPTDEPVSIMRMCEKVPEDNNGWGIAHAL